MPYRYVPRLRFSRCVLVLLLVLSTRTRLSGQTGTTTPPASRATELAKFDDPKLWIPKSGPGGTTWDAQYRSFIQTDANATSKGLPTHVEASSDILADARLSRDKLLQHKGWALYIKSFSEAYRPPEATADLKALYTRLVELEVDDTSTTASSHPTIATSRASGAPFDGDARVTIHRDVIYGRISAEAQRMDAYLVHSSTPAPVVVEFHGGGWRNGGKSEFNAYAGDLISKIIDEGISVISVEYRQTPEYWFPAMMDDAARAIQFIRSKAREWNIDPTRIVAMGGSAGAHLSAWVALHNDLGDPSRTDPINRQSSRLAGFIDLWGPMDLTRPDPGAMSSINVRGEDFAKAFLQVCACTPEQYRSDPNTIKRLREASPLFLVSKGDPPGLIVHQGPEITGKDHPPVPAVINDPHSWQQGVLLADAMDAAGLTVVRHIAPTAGKDPVKDVPVILGFLRERFRKDR